MTLSAETKALLAKGAAVAPLSPEHRSRLRRSVLASAAAGAVVGTTSKSAGSTGATSGGAGSTGASLTVGMKFATAVVAIGALTGAGVAWHRISTSHGPPSSARVATAPSSTPLAATPIATASSESAIATTPLATPTIAVSDLPEARPVARPTPPARSNEGVAAAAANHGSDPTAASASEARSPDALSLQEEARLIREADRATKDGEPARALRLLDDHAARFPNGALEPERAAARIFALCKAGRVADAQRDGDRFLSVERPAALVSRVRASCATRQ